MSSLARPPSPATRRHLRDPRRRWQGLVRYGDEPADWPRRRRLSAQGRGSVRAAVGRRGGGTIASSPSRPPLAASSRLRSTSLTASRHRRCRRRRLRRDHRRGGGARRAAAVVSRRDLAEAARTPAAAVGSARRLIQRRAAAAPRHADAFAVRDLQGRRTRAMPCPRKSSAERRRRRRVAAKWRCAIIHPFATPQVCHPTRRPRRATRACRVSTARPARSREQTRRRSWVARRRQSSPIERRFLEPAWRRLAATAAAAAARQEQGNGQQQIQARVDAAAGLETPVGRLELRAPPPQSASSTFPWEPEPDVPPTARATQGVRGPHGVCVGACDSAACGTSKGPPVRTTRRASRAPRAACSRRRGSPSPRRGGGTIRSLRIASSMLCSPCRASRGRRRRRAPLHDR